MLPVFGSSSPAAGVLATPSLTQVSSRNPLYKSVFGASLSDQQNASPSSGVIGMAPPKFSFGGPEIIVSGRDVEPNNVLSSVFARGVNAPLPRSQVDPTGGAPEGSVFGRSRFNDEMKGKGFPPVFASQPAKAVSTTGDGILLSGEVNMPLTSGNASGNGMSAAATLPRPKQPVFASNSPSKDRLLSGSVPQITVGDGAPSTSILGEKRPFGLRSKRNFDSMETAGSSPVFRPLFSAPTSVFANTKRAKGEGFDSGMKKNGSQLCDGSQRCFETAAPVAPTQSSMASRAPEQLSQHTLLEKKRFQCDETAKPPDVVRAFSLFMSNIMNGDEAKRELAKDPIEAVFFSAEATRDICSFAVLLQRLQSTWLVLQGSAPKLKGERWVVLFALGAHLNFVTRTVQQGEETNENKLNEGSRTLRNTVLEDVWGTLVDSCSLANLLCEICLQLFSNQQENHVPYCVLPIVLRRARTVFELACERGVATVQSNMRSILLKLHRYVRVAAPKQRYSTAVDKQRAVAFASLLSEMMLHGTAPPESKVFVEAFHKYCVDAVSIRCELYSHSADNLLQQPLTDSTVAQAMDLLARAFVVRDENTEERHLLFVKLTACALALGRVPSPDFQEAFGITGLEDLIVAVRSCNIRLFDTAMRNNSEFYVRRGIHNVLQLVAKRVSLLMVVKYYSTCFSDRIHVQDMIDYYKLPYTLSEGCNVWLLPLLVEKRINGVLESGVLVLSNTNPFDDYSKDAIRAFTDEENA